ncbi:chromosome partitioning protein ParB [Nitratiruptor sp. SB155-2]|nr:chromosome partitioning protein ParB [Nitratiruptor sp. SB155-2]
MPMSKKKSLGKGLGSILGEVAEAYEKELPQNEEVVEIEIDQIRKNPYQPRRYFDEKALHELAESIRSHGLLQPIVVIEDIDGFMLIAGERRLRASKLAGLKTIKAIVAKVDKNKYREFALIENIQRENLTPLELAQSYKELIEEYGITHEELANIVKKSRTHITNTLRLLQLSDYAQKALGEGKITFGHAKVIVGLDEKEQQIMVDSIIGQRLSVRDVEKYIQNKKKSVSKGTKTRKNEIDLNGLKTRLTELGFTAKIKKDGVLIAFDNDEEVKRFIDLLK